MLFPDKKTIKERLEEIHNESFGWTLSCCANNFSEAQDVLQTVYLKILEGRARYGGKAAFKTWLFSVIRKTAIDARRRTFLYRMRLSQYSTMIELNHHPSGEEVLEKKWHCRQLRQVLGALPERQKTVLQLVFYHEMTLEAAAKVMGVTTGTASVHYDRGKKRLAKLIKLSQVYDE